jgi:hypothetical protein
MAQSLLTKRENNRARSSSIRLKPKEIPLGISDWDSYLYSLWLEKMALNPGFYDDAKIFHGYRCDCCSRTIILTEVKKKKK